METSLTVEVEAERVVVVVAEEMMDYAFVVEI